MVPALRHQGTSTGLQGAAVRASASLQQHRQMCSYLILDDKDQAIPRFSVERREGPEPSYGCLEPVMHCGGLVGSMDAWIERGELTRAM